VAFEGHFGDPLSNVLAPLNNFGTDEATHLEFGRQIVQVLADYEGYFSACTQLRAVCQP